MQRNNQGIKYTRILPCLVEHLLRLERGLQNSSSELSDASVLSRSPAVSGGGVDSNSCPVSRATKRCLLAELCLQARHFPSQHTRLLNEQVILEPNHRGLLICKSINILALHTNANCKHKLLAELVLYAEKKMLRPTALVGVAMPDTILAATRSAEEGTDLIHSW